MPARLRLPLVLPAFVLLLAALAWARPLNHDESQYVAAALLVADGHLPYRDFAYLQTPLQPVLLAPLAAMADEWVWPALRLANAFLGAGMVLCVFVAARRAGAAHAPALAAAALLATCDIFLFSVGTARNDALPAALFAAALIPIARAEFGTTTRGSAMLAGLLLAAAAAAKVSYALPAGAYALYALVDRRHRPVWIAAGAAPILLGVASSAWSDPAAFWFGTVTFPALAPEEYYAATGRGWRTGLGARTIDTLKFLALGPALLAIPVALRGRWRAGRAFDVLLAAAVLASVLPAPTWRQYLLPLLPVLFVRLAVMLTRHPPGPRLRMAFAAFAVIGFVPTIVALASGRPAMPTAVRAADTVDDHLDRVGIGDGVVTLAPELLAGRSPDPRFAAGPFYFRSRALLDTSDERAFDVISHRRLHLMGRPPALLTGAEAWTSGDARLDAMLDHWARTNGYQAYPLPERLTLWLRPPAAASPPPVPRSNS
ncbi:glycosyltransferase 87 family protein [Sphingomonas sp.]|uniref:glycosyltransferase 87 family protein n=1 Tax=Sphingomonas sp. TaxID=28214 RepID=UPI0035C83634